jgi:hypothetical protein
MRVYLEGVSWDDDGAGTVRATVFDDKHDSLVVEKTDNDRVTFHTDGTPSFDVSTTMEVMALSVVMARSALRGAAETPPDRHHGSHAEATAGTASVPAAATLIPGPNGARRAPEARTHAQPG